MTINDALYILGPIRAVQRGQVFYLDGSRYIKHSTGSGVYRDVERADVIAAAKRRLRQVTRRL